MIPKDDARRTLEFDDHYVIQPDFHFWGKRFKENGGKPVADDFEYNSDTNPWRLHPEEMLEILKNL
jgi:UDP-N-acetylglucosamine 4,6-dehydratase